MQCKQNMQRNMSATIQNAMSRYRSKHGLLEHTNVHPDPIQLTLTERYSQQFYPARCVGTPLIANEQDRQIWNGTEVLTNWAANIFTKRWPDLPAYPVTSRRLVRLTNRQGWVNKLPPSAIGIRCETLSYPSAAKLYGTVLTQYEPWAKWPVNKLWTTGVFSNQGL